METMKKNFFYLLLLGTILFSASCKDDNEPQTIEGRYQQEVFTGAEVEALTNITYGHNTTASGAEKDLILDFYAPKGDTETKRPLIIMVVGGAFLQPITSRAGFTELAKTAARYGYAVANIDYRTYDLSQYPVDSITSYRNALRARADLKAAIRYFRKDAAAAKQYKINPDKIFALGHSAGAITSLAAAYMNSDDDYTQQVLALINEEGGFEGDSGNPGYASNLNGVVSLSGGVWRRDLVDANEAPVLCIHGTADEVVPYGSGYVVIPNAIDPLYIEGSEVIDARAQAIGLKHELITIQGGDHSSPLNPAKCPDCISEIANFLYELL